MESKINLVNSIPKPVQITEDKPVETQKTVQPAADERSFRDKNKTAVIAIGALALAGITFAVTHKSGSNKAVSEAKDNITKTFKELYQEAVKGKKSSFVNPKTGRTHAFEYDKDGKLVKETIKKGDEFNGEYAVFGDVSKPHKLKRGNKVYEYEYAAMTDGAAKPSSRRITFLEEVKNKEGEIIHPKDSQAVTYFSKEGKPVSYESVVKTDLEGEMFFEVSRADAVANAKGKAEPGSINYKGIFKNKELTNPQSESFYDSDGKLVKHISHMTLDNGKSITTSFYAKGENLPYRTMTEHYSNIANVNKPVLSGKSVFVQKPDGREFVTEIKFILDAKGNVTGKTIESHLPDGRTKQVKLFTI